jgi:hypothetical protein
MAITGHKVEAYGANPAQDLTYSLRYKVVDIGDLIASHTDTLAVNPKYPGELQPRIRERAASRLQIDTMAENLNAKVLLRDTGFLDTGPMIVGADNVVESGNGRVLALRKALGDHPEKYRLYRTMLVNQAADYGLDEDAIKHLTYPVLVRERLTPVDRVKFAAEANTSNVLAMSPFEQAMQDAKRLSVRAVQNINVGDDESIDQALRRKANADVVARFYESIPANERASIVDNKGEITPAGLSRLKLAIFTKTYTGEAGQRLARIFSESTDPNIKNVEHALFQSLPDMAKAESLIASGDRDKSLSVAPDIAEVVDAYASLKAKGMTVDNYLHQSSMLGERLNPGQRQLLEHIGDIGRSQKKVREFTRDIATQVENAPPPGQTGMFGEEYAITKEGIINASINKQRAESGKPPITYAVSTRSQRLEKPDTGGDGAIETVQSGPVAVRQVQEPEAIKQDVVAAVKDEKPTPTIASVLHRPQTRKQKAITANEPTQTAPEVSRAVLETRQEHRSPQSLALDNARQHHIVIPPWSKQARQWLKDQGSMDIEGIDTKHTISERTADLNNKKRGASISGGGKGTFPLGGRRRGGRLLT